VLESIKPDISLALLFLFRPPLIFGHIAIIFGMLDPAILGHAGMSGMEGMKHH